MSKDEAGRLEREGVDFTLQGVINNRAIQN